MTSYYHFRNDFTNNYSLLVVTTMVYRKVIASTKAHP